MYDRYSQQLGGQSGHLGVMGGRGNGNRIPQLQSINNTCDAADPCFLNNCKGSHNKGGKCKADEAYDASEETPFTQKLIAAVIAWRKANTGKPVRPAQKDIMDQVKQAHGDLLYQRQGKGRGKGGRGRGGNNAGGRGSAPAGAMFCMLGSDKPLNESNIMVSELTAESVDPRDADYEDTPREQSNGVCLMMFGDIARGDQNLSSSGSSSEDTMANKYVNFKKATPVKIPPSPTMLTPEPSTGNQQPNAQVAQVAQVAQSQAATETIVQSGKPQVRLVDNKEAIAVNKNASDTTAPAASADAAAGVGVEAATHERTQSQPQSAGSTGMRRFSPSMNYVLLFLVAITAMFTTHVMHVGMEHVVQQTTSYVLPRIPVRPRFWSTPQANAQNDAAQIEHHIQSQLALFQHRERLWMQQLLDERVVTLRSQIEKQLLAMTPKHRATLSSINVRTMNQRYAACFRRANIMSMPLNVTRQMPK